MENDNLTGPHQSLIHTDEDRIYEVFNVDLRDILCRLGGAFNGAWDVLLQFQPYSIEHVSALDKLNAQSAINRVRCLCEDAAFVLRRTVNFYGFYPEPLNETLTCKTAMQEKYNPKLFPQRIQADEDQGKICGYFTPNEVALNRIIGKLIPLFLEIMKGMIDSPQALVSNISFAQMAHIIEALKQWKPERVARRLFNPDLVELQNVNSKNNSTDSQIPHVNRTRKARVRVSKLSDLVAEQVTIIDLDYRPATYFKKGAADRLRMASRKNRKSKRVKSKKIDGVKCYSLADVRQWFPNDVPKDA